MIPAWREIFEVVDTSALYATIMIYVPAAMREAPVPHATSQIILCSVYLLDLTSVKRIYFYKIKDIIFIYKYIIVESDGFYVKIIWKMGTYDKLIFTNMKYFSN